MIRIPQLPTDNIPWALSLNYFSHCFGWLQYMIPWQLITSVRLTNQLITSLKIVNIKELTFFTYYLMMREGGYF